MITTQANHAIENAQGHLESIRELMARLDAANEKSDDSFEPISEEIAQYPLSVQIRSDWHDPGADSDPGEYEILLTTGGPALRIAGDLDRHEPTNARMEWQDWGTPWTELHGADMPDALKPSEWDDVILRFARHFYYGEG